MRMEALLGEHRERENNLRNTLLTAQRLVRRGQGAAQTEAKLIVREAQGRADLLLQKAQVRLEEMDRDINEMKLRRRDAEGAVEATIQALYRALEFIRDQDQTRADEKVLLHRPRQDGPARRRKRATPGRRVAKSAKRRAEAVLDVRVIPALAAHAASTALRGGAILIRLAAPPVDGAANDALVAFLAEALGVPRRGVSIVVGREVARQARPRSTARRSAVHARLLALTRRLLGQL